MFVIPVVSAIVSDLNKHNYSIFLGAVVSASGITTGPIFLDGLKCLGTETNLLANRCHFFPIGITDCELNTVVTLQCKGQG